MKDSLNKILPHSQAKLDLYQKYLEKYFSILGLAKGISKINIYDLFSGTGIYEDGKVGSPILAFQTIKDNRFFFTKKNWPLKPISLFINDKDSEKVETVRLIIEEKGLPEKFQLECKSSDVIELFSEITERIEVQDGRERNLLFIDPYGYKTINPHVMRKLLQNGRTEIILFLPISFMHRFKNISLREDKACYKALNEFVTSLFPLEHPMREPEDLSIHDFIDYITKGFTFKGNNYCVSHSIERSKNNFFAVFFMTKHILGLERMLTVKWGEDNDFGKAYLIKKESNQLGLFTQLDKETNQKNNYQKLSEILLRKISNKHEFNNLDLYESTLKNEFLPKHSNQVMRDLKKAKRIKVLDAVTRNEIEKPRTYFNKWDDFRTKQPKIIIQKA